MPVYLIDGYNVLYEIRARGTGESGRRRAKRKDAARGSAERPTKPFQDADELESERRRLVDRVAGYIASQGSRALIVFDSKSSLLERAEETAPDIEVFFGSFSQSADDIIERAAYGIDERESIVVVTSDYAIQQTTFRANVSRLSSRQFVQELQRYTTRLANSEDCIRMGHRVEERIDKASLDRLKRLRDTLGRGSDSD